MKLRCPGNRLRMKEECASLDRVCFGQKNLKLHMLKAMF